MAQQPPDLLRLMIVIHDQLFFLFADQALPSLLFEHRVILRLGHIISFFKIVLSV